MTEDEIRAIVRETLARRLGSPGSDPGHPDPPPADLRSGRPASHASHLLFPIPGGSALDGPCLIEPVVMCSHCGYCQSYGH